MRPSLIVCVTLGLTLSVHAAEKKPEPTSESPKEKPAEKKQPEENKGASA